MSFWKKLLIGLGLVIMIGLGPSFLYGLLTDGGDVPNELVAVEFILAALVLLGTIVYLAVDLALRQNRR